MTEIVKLDGLDYIKVDQEWYWDIVGELRKHLIGKSIISANSEAATMTLSNGTILKFEQSASDCCSYFELSCLRGTDNNIITEVSEVETYTGYDWDDTPREGEGPYTAKIQVLTESGIVDIAEGEGDASNGYYLHGFALRAEVFLPVVEHEVVAGEVIAP